MTDKPITPVEYLEKMQDILNERGWVKGFMISPKGVCLQGAACETYDYFAQQRAYSDREDIAAGSGRAYAALDGQVNDMGYSSIPLYNDDPNTSYEDVQLLIKRSIESLECTYG